MYILKIDDIVHIYSEIPMRWGERFKLYKKQNPQPPPPKKKESPS